jgi:hypothetical protein
MDLLTSTENNDVLEDCPMEMSDAVLVSTAKSGDTDAFAELTKRHSNLFIDARRGTCPHDRLPDDFSITCLAFFASSPPPDL